MKLILEGNIIFPDKTQYGQLIIDNEVIQEIITEQEKFFVPDIKAKDGDYISPGFIDIQINGGFGKEFKTNDDAIQVISDKIYEFGTTSFCPTITTSELTKYEEFVKRLISKYSFNGQTKLIGLHFEGPMLNPQKVGAQNSSLLKLPSEVNLENYLNPNTKIVTLSPELEDAQELIKILIEKNIKVGVGHSTIKYDELQKIFDENNMMIVHLFNAMDGLSSREPGLAGAGLANENYTISLIVDGIHVHPATLKIIWNSKLNKRKIICISDGSAVTGLDAGIYKIGEREIHKSTATATLPNGTLVGSILTLNVAVKNLINYCCCTLNEAVNTVSLNPATYLGVENEIGQIKKGNKADIVIFNEQIEVQMTIINGYIKHKK